MRPQYPEGHARRLLSLRGDDSCIELVAYLDGQLGVIRDGRTVGIWPASAETECIVAFHKLAVFRDAEPCLVISRSAFEAASAAVAALN